jgi:hypothetical protein
LVLQTFVAPATKGWEKNSGFNTCCVASRIAAIMLDGLAIPSGNVERCAVIGEGE